jgi:hypothetical protein
MMLLLKDMKATVSGAGRSHRSFSLAQSFLQFLEQQSALRNNSPARAAVCAQLHLKTDLN